MRSILLLTFPFLIAATGLSAADADTQEVTFDKPVQVPDSVLQPGRYTIHLEDHLPDRAIVRITEPGGAQHFLLTVPSKTLSPAKKGLVFFPGSDSARVLHGWGCADCGKPLEFVYPKDEAVKLTAETGKPILAFDPSYDKLPASLSAEDRKIVTLWLLSPKTVTPQGKGEGLTAAKYSSPRLMAAAEPLPRTMPKTSSNAFSEIALGIASILLAALLYSRRRWVVAKQQ